MSKFLDFLTIETKFHIMDMKGIDMLNTIVTLNEQGEFVLLFFDDNLKTSSEVLIKDFPGYSGELYTDPEYRMVWLKRGSGVYFADIESRKKGHCICMFPGSKIYQIILAEPENKKWYIAYGQFGGREFDLFDLENDTQISEYRFTRSEMYRFSNNRILLWNTIDDGPGFWQLVDSKLTFPAQPSDKYAITKKMTELQIVPFPGIANSYSLKTKIMIGYSHIFQDCSIRWDENEEEVEILPFTCLHRDSNIAHLMSIKNFSPDGCWFDKFVIFKSNGIRKLEGRIVYNVGSQYPIGVSPPLQLGLCRQDNPAAFMQHSIFGPCYVMADENNTMNIKLYKLNKGYSIIEQRLK